MTAQRSSVWLTPPALIEALGGFQAFDLDPCSLDARPWPTARAHYAPPQDGLTLPWWGRVWLNPPYTTHIVSRFLARMVDHGQGVALVFARTDTEHFFRYVWGAATGLLFLPGRLNFHRPDGCVELRANGTPENAGAPSVLVAYGREEFDILGAAPIEGHLVPLRLPRAILGAVLGQTWDDALQSFFVGCDEPVNLDQIYRAFVDHPKTRSNQHWRAKLRQSLQRGEFERVARGVWKRRAA